jgi:hypothetical protein
MAGDFGYGKLSHGHTRIKDGKRIASSEYVAWQSMRTRCLNPNCKDWKNYGGRGITIDPRWNKFENFIEDMGFKPAPEYSLDRMDNNGPYTNSNCRWTLRSDQNYNRRSKNKFASHQKSH